MGIFSFLKKKNEAQPSGALDPPYPQPASAGMVTRQAHDIETKRETKRETDRESERARQRAIARATAAKIDEIELEMVSAIFEDDAWSGGRRAPASSAVTHASGSAAPGMSAFPAPDLEVPELTDILVETPDAAADPSHAPAVEEAALLHADGQDDAAEQVLLASLREGGRSERLPWRMLLDLYQIAGREQDFESIAIDYASLFETSPPAYQPPVHAPTDSDAGRAFAGPTPTASLSGLLDDGIAAALARVLASSPSPVVRIEFSGITGATAQGCALLLDALQRLRYAGRELVLAGADGLIAAVRPMLAIGERRAGPAPWLLLLELLLLTNREKAFEETAMDYCITFEVSPPSFERPARAALSLEAGPAVDGDRFLLPAVVEGADAAALWAALDAYTARPGTLVLDCSRLARIDYPAASALGERLRALAADDGKGTASGRRIALRDLNHLVAALLYLLGVDAAAQLATRK